MAGLLMLLHIFLKVYKSKVIDLFIYITKDGGVFMGELLKSARERQLIKEYAKLQNQNKELKETLSFYADKGNYDLNKNFYKFKKTSENATFFLHKVDRDEGKLARDTLSRFE